MELKVTKARKTLSCWMRGC